MRSIALGQVFDVCVSSRLTVFGKGQKDLELFKGMVGLDVLHPIPGAYATGADRRSVALPARRRLPAVSPVDHCTSFALRGDNSGRGLPRIGGAPILEYSPPLNHRSLGRNRQYRWARVRRRSCQRDHYAPVTWPGHMIGRAPGQGANCLSHAYRHVGKFTHPQFQHEQRPQRVNVIGLAR